MAWDPPHRNRALEKALAECATLKERLVDAGFGIEYAADHCIEDDCTRLAPETSDLCYPHQIEYLKARIKELEHPDNGE